jgi:endonuclease G
MSDHAERVAAYVRAIMQRDGVSADDLPTAAGPVVTTSSAPGPGARPALMPPDLDALRKVEQRQPLTPREAARIEAIVLPNGLRPAFDIFQDSYEEVPDTWKRLNERRADIIPLIRGIGRVDLSGHPSKVFAGTAFVVGPDLLLTNRHVAEFFVDGLGDAPALHFKPGVSASIDLKQEVSTLDSIRLTVVAPALVLDAWDAALLRLASLPAGISTLKLAGSAPSGLDGRLAAVIGYPAIDEASDLIQQIQIFRGVFFKKRLMPGRLTGFRQTTSFGKTVNALAHDCTTLGGNSGSSLIDVESALVVGLHFAGEHLVSNYAVPSWELAADSRLAAAGVEFV